MPAEDGAATHESIRISVAHEAGSGAPALVTMAGELDLSNSGAARARLDDVGVAARHVILDLQQLGFIDSTGLSTIVRLGKQLKERNGRLAIVVTKPSIRKLFAITALDKRFALHERLEDVKFS